MKVIKLYAWEPPFIKKVGEVREKELCLLKKVNLLRAGFYATWMAAPKLMTIIIFTLYTTFKPGHQLSPTVAFVSLSLIERCRNGLDHLPYSITDIVEVIS